VSFLFRGSTKTAKRKRRAAATERGKQHAAWVEYPSPIWPRGLAKGGGVARSTETRRGSVKIIWDKNQIAARNRVPPELLNRGPQPSEDEGGLKRYRRKRRKASVRNVPIESKAH